MTGTLDLFSVFLFLSLLLFASSLVVASLGLGREEGLPKRHLFPSSRVRRSLVVGQDRKKIEEYLGRLADEFQPVAEEEKLATPEGSVSIPMAIAVRGEIRILLPVDATATDDLMESTLRRVALIRKHRYPGARIVFLSDRPLPVELSLCSHPQNPIGRLLVEMALLGGSSAPDGQLTFRQVFEGCTSQSISLSLADLDAIDAFLDSELVTGPVTPSLRRLARLLGKHVEWVLAGILPGSLTAEEGMLRLAVEGGDLELDLQLLGLETLYGGGRVSIAGLVRDIVAIKADPRHVPTEVNPAILQRFPTANEVRQHRPAADLLDALSDLAEERCVRLNGYLSGEELVSIYRCSCGALVRRKSQCNPESPCRSLSDVEARLMESLQHLGRKVDQRCHYCHGKLTGRDLSLLLLAHPFVELRTDLWVSLHRLASGKFWWRLSRLRRNGVLTHYAGVLSPETFRRAFGRFYSVKEGWQLLFERVDATLRRQRLRAEKGLVLHATPEGGRRPPAGVRRGALLFGKRLLVPILARLPATLPRSPHDLGPATDWVSSLAPNLPASAWCEASVRPFMKVFRRTIKDEGGRLLGRGTKLVVLHKNGGESFRDVEQEIERNCRMGTDYLVSARQAAIGALRQAGEVGRYLRRSQEALGPSAKLRHDPRRDLLEITDIPLGSTTSVSMKDLMRRIRPDDGSFDRFLRAAAWHCDLGVGLDVCGCGAKAFIAKKLRSAGWPKSYGEKLAADGSGELVCRVTGPISEVFTRECGLHSHYLTVRELGERRLTLKDLDARFRRELPRQRFRLKAIPAEVDAHLFLLCFGTDAASIVLSGSLARGLVEASGVPLGRKALRFRVISQDGLVLGDPEAPRMAFAGAARLLRRQSGQEVAPMRHEGLLTLPPEGEGHFDLE